MQEMWEYGVEVQVITYKMDGQQGPARNYRSYRELYSVSWTNHSGKDYKTECRYN